MKKRNFILLLLAAIVTIPLFAAENQIGIRKKPGPQTGSRTIEGAVTASINDKILTISFADVTSSSVIVYDATDPDTLLFSQKYAPAYSAQADLTSLFIGEYVVEIFASDEWWIGEFEIE